MAGAHTGEPPPSRTVGGGPASFAQTMDALAAWIDHVDKILVRRGEKAGPSNGQVQRDLRRVARAVREDPTLDDLMMDAMLHGPDPDPDND